MGRRKKWLFGCGTLVAAILVSALYLWIRLPSLLKHRPPPEPSIHTYVCTGCRKVFNCPAPLLRIVGCPLCKEGDAYRALQCNNPRHAERQRGRPHLFPYIVSKEVFPWVADNHARRELMASPDFKRTPEVWRLRNKILVEYPKCPNCGWGPGSGYTESVLAGPCGVGRHFDPDAPVFECKSLDGPDAYPGPTPQEIIESLKRYGRLPAPTEGTTAPGEGDEPGGNRGDASGKSPPPSNATGDD